MNHWSFFNETIEANDPQGMGNLDHRGMVDRIYIGDHFSLLHTTYMSRGFREEDLFLSFSILSLWKLMTPQGMANFDSRGHGWQLGRINVKDHLTFLYTVYILVVGLVIF